MTATGRPSWHTAACLRAALVAALALGFCRASLVAGGPLLVAENGSPFAWRTSSPIILNPERGRLGDIAAPAALLEHATREWSGVATAVVEIVNQPLSRDFPDLDAAEFDRLSVRDDGTNPIIFDEDGTIFEDLFGPRSGVLALAGPTLTIPSRREIIKGAAIFNGAEARADTEELLKAVFTHEVGHLLNLDHTQVNGARLGESVPGFGVTARLEDISTMFPMLPRLADRPHPMATLAQDDRVALSALYPAGSFASTTGTITGFVFDFDARTPLAGVNVVARSVDDPLGDAVSYVAGQLARGASGLEPAALRGYYELRGLTPDATYKLSIEEISSDFTGGSGVGPIDPPVDLVPAEKVAFLEFWNGARETGSDPPDDPLEAEEVRLRAGETRARLDVIFNGALPRVSSIVPASGDYTMSHEVTISGANFGSFLEARLRGPASVLLDAALVSRSEVEAIVPAFLVPGDYEVEITTERGASALGEAAYRVTEPPPVVESFAPAIARNDRRTQITVSGTHLLGTRAMRLVSGRLPEVVLESLAVTFAGDAEADVDAAAASFYVAVASIPRGALPGSYHVVVVNTAAESLPSTEAFEIVELAPALSGDVEPSVFNNSRDVDVRIFGDNLAGTSSVEIVGTNERGEMSQVGLAIVSTSLAEVVATVPARTEPGVYSVRLTNTIGSVSSETEVTITAAGGGGGGGGCSAVVGADPTDAIPDFPLLLVALVVLRVIMWRPRWKLKDEVPAEA